MDAENVVLGAVPTETTEKRGTRVRKNPAKAKGWAPYFLDRHSDRSSVAARRLDYSNDRVQYQTYGALIEAAGPLKGVKCLDAGCGFGDLSRILFAGGAHVDAFDVVDETVRWLKLTHSNIRFFTADLAELNPEQLSDQYGLVMAAEVLQYADPAASIRTLFKLVAPGGRLVGCVPNSKCPLISSASKRFAGRYSAISIEDLVSTLSALPAMERFSWRGAHFQEDQTLFPYRLTSWSRSPLPAVEAQPNRLHFVVSKL
jgi:2-polyprenyl-3-methyl-5-hydroxy-6-metoxy-1,4-benzoquinol methylase